MGMPTEEELQEALAEAARMREHGEDPHHIAKALLNINYQNEQLKHVLRAVELYFNSGMAVAEHQKLKKAVEQARLAVHRTGAIEEEHFGLR
ncbi:MAG: hypothetical protein OQK94_01930 [Gammaproteobacteria bacterium]|nr:hypothetical protein [Gammaproteobacteria bacterium]MCW8840612.1 hypothetical protein [Gammaproteobacteria bacterium]MCW8973617.1 hypothetical protein [Gammaproteobacteria bacterium]MCW8993749.1 hypothetical protein [Gammaproteobacteria bacterium]